MNRHLQTITQTEKMVLLYRVSEKSHWQGIVYNSRWKFTVKLCKKWRAVMERLAIMHRTLILACLHQHGGNSTWYKLLNKHPCSESASEVTQGTKEKLEKTIGKWNAAFWLFEYQTPRQRSQQRTLINKHYTSSVKYDGMFTCPNS